MLNPQPLSPKAGRFAQPWQFELDLQSWNLGPLPDPWLLAVLAHGLIDRVVSQYQFAEALGATAQSEKAIGSFQSYISDVVVEWCGTRPPKWPWPSGLDATQLSPMALLAAGVQFQKAAAFDNPLRASLSDTADQLFETGLKRMEEQAEEQSDNTSRRKAGN